MAKKAPKSKGSLTATTSASDANNRTRAMAEKKKALKLKSPVKTKRAAQERRVSEKARNPISAKKSKVKPKKKSKREDANKPKKPPTAFFFFLEDFRKEYQEQNPDVKSMRDIGKACGEKWKTMTYEEKVNYYDVATEKRAEFDKAMADYIKKKESGEDQEYEEDSEFDE